MTSESQRSDTGPEDRVPRGGSGLTVIELILALAIVGLIAGVTVMAIHQLLTSSRQAADLQYAVTQLQYAEHRITRDAMMAQEITEAGFPLTLAWVDPDTGIREEVTYSFIDPTSDSTQLVRNSNQVGSSHIAGSMSAVRSTCEFGTYGELPSPTLRIALIAPVASEHFVTRSFEVQPRSTKVEPIDT